MIKGIYFDWGGVLIENPSIPLLQFIAKRFGKTEVEMRKLLDTEPELFALYQTGEIAEKEIWKKIFNKNDLNVWSDAVKATFTLQREVVDFAVKMKASNYKIGILSNTEKEAVDNLDLFFEPNFFSYEVFSCSVHSAKPDNEIYNYAVKLMDLKPEEILFIDDRKDFIEGAKQAGLQTYQFSDISQIKMNGNFMNSSWR